MISSPDPAAWRALRHLLGGPRQGADRVAPQALAAAARIGQVTALAARADAAVAPLLAESLDGRAMQDLCLVAAERRLASDLAAAGHDRWALLKGSATCHLLYEQTSDRERTDVDVLVAERAFDAVIESLLAAGWRDETHPGLWAAAGGAQPWERTLTVEVAGTRVGADLHRRLVRWRQFTPDHDGVIARASETTSGLRLSHPEDLLLHGAVHAANAAFDVPLRSYVDVARLVDRSDLDWDRTAGRARSWGIATALWATLDIAGRWLGAAAPDRVMQTLAPSRPTRRALERALRGEADVPTSSPLRGRLAYVVIPALVRRGAAARVGFAAEYARTRVSHAVVTARRPGTPR